MLLLLSSSFPSLIWARDGKSFLKFMMSSLSLCAHNKCERCWNGQNGNVRCGSLTHSLTFAEKTNRFYCVVFAVCQTIMSHFTLLIIENYIRKWQGIFIESQSNLVNVQQRRIVSPKTFKFWSLWRHWMFCVIFRTVTKTSTSNMLKWPEYKQLKRFHFHQIHSNTNS